jgi:plasmid stabilization system protein ParE
MVEKYFIKWAAPARDDLDDIIEYIAQTNITYAVKILDEIELAVKNLDTSPKRGRIVPELERYGYVLYREIIVGLVPKPTGFWNSLNQKRIFSLCLNQPLFLCKFPKCWLFYRELQYKYLYHFYLLACHKRMNRINIYIPPVHF